MLGFDFDMAVAVSELDAGMAHLLDKLGYGWLRHDRDAGAIFDVRLPSSHRVRVDIGPLPRDRVSTAVFLPRTSLRADSDDASDAELDLLRQAIIRAFLRVMG